jgi:hypothetical protein
MGCLPALWLLGASAPALAAYSPSDPDMIYVSTGYRYDDNVLLLSDKAAVPDGYGTRDRGDLIKSFTLGGQLQKQWQSQTFSFNTEYVLNRYQHYLSADYTAKNNSLGWNGVLADRLKGSLLASQQDELAGADSASLGQHDLIHMRNLQGKLSWPLTTLLSLDGQASHSSERNSTLTDYDYNQDDAGLALVANGADGKSLALKVESRNVAYLQDLSLIGWNDRYQLQYLTLNGAWPLGAHWSVSARAGNVRVLTDQQTDRNHSVAEIKTVWSPSEKSQLTLDLEHDYDAPGRSLAPVVHDSAHLDALWQITGKTGLSASWHLERRDYPAPMFNNGRENTQSLQLGVIWKPYPAVQVQPYVAHTLRSSQLASDNYRDQQLGISVQLEF